jgi:glutathione peroxidase-family protein
MKLHFYIPFLLIVLASCNSNKFTIEGVVKDAQGDILYFEHTGLLKITLMDSVKLGSKGKFRFSAKKPDYPDFYRLRLDNKFINFAVDSTENILIEAAKESFSTDYKIEGSIESNQIKDLRLSVIQIQRKANQLKEGMTLEERNSLIADIEANIQIHKEKARKIILQNPRSTAAYFAIYQQVNNAYIFSPFESDDKPFCAAVATSWNTYMPDYERTKNLYNWVMDAIKAERQEKQRQAWRDVIESEGKGYIDIELNDKNGISQRLSALEGKVILVDFSVYESDKSVPYTFELRELYNKYHTKGLEIYQVSIDRNKILWESSVENIPWICVRDESGVFARNYNVLNLPTIFLINRKGDIVGRFFDFKEIDKEIQKLL